MNKVHHYNFISGNPRELADFFSCSLKWTLNKGKSDSYSVNSQHSRFNIYQASNKLIIRPKLATVLRADSIENTLLGFAANGGSITSPKTKVTGGGHYAMAKDPDGNIFIIIESSL